MKKNFAYYALIWAVLMAVFCAIVFLVRPIIPGFTIAYDARFWVAFAFIILAAIVNLFCAFVAFGEDNQSKLFLNLPLITISWAALIAMLLVGAILMLIPNCPAWITAIICILIMGIDAISVIKASWATETVNNIDNKIRPQTAFIRNLTVDAQSILARAQSDYVRGECNKVYDAIRYSDPMSNDALSVIEAKITVKMDEFSTAVVSDNSVRVREIADELVILVAERNNKCRALK